ncbi:MAG: uroporphyrinogen decarboxylase family protein [Clostridiales bacterium]
MNSKERVLAALNMQQPDRVPFLDDVDPETMDVIMGKTDYTLAEFAQKLGLDGVSIRSYSAPAFYETHQGEDGRVFMGNGMIRQEKDLDLMVFPDPKKPGFFDELNRFVDDNGNAGLATYAEMRWGPSGAFYSMGMEPLAYALFDNPKFVEKVLDRYAEYSIEILETINTIGLDFVITYDDICYKNGPVMSPKFFREMFIPREKKVAEACKIPWVCHMDGNVTKILDDLLTLGMNGLHPIEPAPNLGLKEMKEKVGNKVCLWGNVDLNHILPYGTVDEVEADVKRCLLEGAGGGGYILGSSNGLPNYCKVENILAMAQAVKKYGEYIF